MRLTMKHLRENGHWPTFSRRRVGSSWQNRPLYGWSVTCECGWHQQTNEPKQEAAEWHKDHLRDLIEA